MEFSEMFFKKCDDRNSTIDLSDVNDTTEQKNLKIEKSTLRFRFSLSDLYFKKYFISKA